MRILTSKERRAIKLNLKGFNKEKLTIVLDMTERAGMNLLGLDCMDGEHLTRLLMPLKNEVDIDKVAEQLKKITKDVRIKEAE